MLGRHKMRIRTMAVLVLAMFLPSMPAFAGGGFRVWVGGGFGGGYVGGFWGGHYPRAYYPQAHHPYYPPAWTGWGPAYYGTRYVYVPHANPASNVGKIQLEGADRLDRVYLDGGYAGIAGDLKTITIKPGTYNLEIRRGGTRIFSQRISVLGAKTLKLNIATPPPPPSPKGD
jgi:hypothetical protein